MKRRIAFIITFVGVHLILITSLVVLSAYRVYPEEVGSRSYVSRSLKEIYDEVGQYKEEIGNFPEKIDSLLHCDKQTGEAYFRSKELSIFPLWDVNNIRYQLIDGEPVITFLGHDGREGGLGKREFDIYYPQKFQPPFLFRDFIRTSAFRKSLAIGLIFSGIISICLFGMWAKQYQRGRFPFHVISLSVIFVLFELFLMQFILYGHIYPHH